MGAGLNLEDNIPDNEAPTWVLRSERDELKNASDLGGLNQVDSERLVELNTLLGVRSQLEN